MKKEKKIVLKDQQEAHSWTLRKKLLGFEVGMTYYCELEKDEEDIVIPFALSLYITSSKIAELLPVYLECLRRNECPEVLGVDLDAMTTMGYWMKNYKLEHDMRSLNDLPLRERGIEFAYKGFKPETTMQLYEAIRQNIADMIAMLTELRQLFAEAPDELYANFYRSQKAACDVQPVINRFERWKREVGVVTPDLLNDKQAQEVAELLKQKVLRFMHTPSKREIDRVDIDRLKEHLPLGYELPEEFTKCYARLMRLVTNDGDSLRIRHDCYGRYLHQFYYCLTVPERQALIHLDLMLDLIREEVTLLAPAASQEAKALLSEPLGTPEAMVLWQKARQAGYVDDNCQPLISRTQSALLADAMARALGIQKKWKPFEALWNRRYMRNDYDLALSQQQSLDFQDELKRVFAD